MTKRDDHNRGYAAEIKQATDWYLKWDHMSETRESIEAATTDLLRSLPLPAVADERERHWGETVRKILRGHFG